MLDGESQHPVASDCPDLLQFTAVLCPGLVELSEDPDHLLGTRGAPWRRLLGRFLEDDLLFVAEGPQGFDTTLVESLNSFSDQLDVLLGHRAQYLSRRCVSARTS